MTPAMSTPAREPTLRSALHLALAAGGLLFSTGCAQTFPTPFTAAQMAQYGSGAALAHYLAQPDATPEVCDLQSHGPHVGPLKYDDFADLTTALARRRIPPEVFKRCATKMLTGRTPEETASFLDAMGWAYRELLHEPEVETDPVRQAQLEMLHQIYLLRPSGSAPHAARMDDWIEDLRRALQRGRLGPVASRYGQDLLASLDLEHGRWQGQPVTAATLDAIAAQKDEPLLRRFAVRLPDPSLQTEARRRIVRLHIAASPWPEVRDHAQQVETAVLSTGRYAVTTAVHPPVKGAVDLAHLPVRGVIARQDVWKQAVTLLAYSGDRPGVSVLPELNLRGVLQVDVQGLSRPVSLCAPREALDVTPCLAPSDVRIANPIAYLDEDGSFHFAEHVSIRDAIAIVSERPDLALPVEVAGRPLITISWSMTFERPQDLIFRGLTGAPGPGLRVRVAEHDPQRLVFTVDAPGNELLAAVELVDAPVFSVVSRGGEGAAGMPGSDGRSGSDGMSGMSASCPSMGGGNGGDGSDGGDGSNGGPGGPGGPGGNVVVEIDCTAGDCARLPSLLQHVVRSEGGPGGHGGAGGRGGRGGRGGSGGSGTSCTDSNGNSYSLPSGMSGHDGRSGHDGMQGSDGPPGPPGHVELTSARQR
jgi:hypothetical protein